MYDSLKSEGVLVTICSRHWAFACHKIDQAFMQWVRDLGVDIDFLHGQCRPVIGGLHIQEIDYGEVKSSGTMTGGYILGLYKS